jgi:hypothetical protein
MVLCLRRLLRMPSLSKLQPQACSRDRNHDKKYILQVSARDRDLEYKFSEETSKGNRLPGRTSTFSFANR